MMGSSHSSQPSASPGAQPCEYGCRCMFVSAG
jgi:hypothetical protein